MKIGILTSSPDMLYLFRAFTKYNFLYHIWYDQEGGHRWDKAPEFVQKRIELWLDYLIGQWAQQCILPPTRELIFLSIEKYKKYIMPLFSTYVIEHCLPGSRMGKLWFIGDWSDLQNQDALKTLCAAYQLNDNQKSIKKFHQPFAYWSKDTSLRKHFLVSLGWKDRMMHNVVKHDLRYFTDAGIDTLIPLNYGYFAYDVTIAKFFLTKKCRRHRLEKIASTFGKLSSEYDQETYSVTMSYTGTIEHLTSEKKRIWLLERGKTVEMQKIHIDL
jgi:hypothetical protein